MNALERLHRQRPKAYPASWLGCAKLRWLAGGIPTYCNSLDDYYSTMRATVIGHFASHGLHRQTRGKNKKIQWDFLLGRSGRHYWSEPEIVPCVRAVRILIASLSPTHALSSILEILIRRIRWLLLAPGHSTPPGRRHDAVDGGSS